MWGVFYLWNDKTELVIAPLHSPSFTGLYNYISPRLRGHGVSGSFQFFDLPGSPGLVEPRL
jgi:hypothetical protein